MTRLLALLGLCFCVIAASGSAWGLDCIPKQGCAAGQAPRTCCQPPPCEIYEQIRMKRATRSLFRNKQVRALLKRKSGGDNAKAAAALSAYAAKRAGSWGRLLRCPWQDPINPPPSFETIPECQVVARLPGGAELMSRQKALATLPTCSEFVEAAYDHEKVHQDACFKTNSVARANMGIDAYAKEEADGYKTEIASLQASLAGYWSACSAVADATTARKLAKAGISVLKKQSLKKKTPAKKRP